MIENRTRQQIKKIEKKPKKKKKKVDTLHIETALKKKGSGLPSYSRSLLSILHHRPFLFLS